MKNLDDLTICNIAEQAFASRGYENLKATIDDGMVSLKLRDRASFVYGESPLIGFEILPEGIMRVNDVWVLPPFPQRQGIGNTWVNGCLKDIAEKVNARKMIAYSLYTDCSEKFWKNLDGWQEEEDHMHSYDIRK